MNIKTFLLTILAFTTGLSAGALIPIYFISINFRAEEPSCSLEKAFREISIGETTYCRSFRLYRRGDGSLIVYQIYRKEGVDALQKTSRRHNDECFNKKS